MVVSLEFGNGRVSAGIASQHFGGVNWGNTQQRVASTRDEGQE